MSDSAPEIKVKLTAEDTGVAAAIRALGENLSQLKQKQNEVAESAINLKGAFNALIASAAAYKIAEFGKEVFATTLSIARMQEKTGLSAGLLSTFSVAAKDSGVSSDQMNMALGRLANSITKFQQGLQLAAPAMKALGISQAELKNLSPDQAIRLVTDRLGAMHDGLQKAAIAQQLMGRGGQALIPVLNELAGSGFGKVNAEGVKSGQILSDDVTAGAVAAAHAFADLKGAGEGIATQFEAGLLPALTDVARGLTGEIEDGGVSAFRTLGEEAGTVMKGIVLTVQTASDIIGALFVGLSDAIYTIMDPIVLTLKGTIEAAVDASKGQFKEAGKAIAAGFHDGVNHAKQDIENLKLDFTVAADQIKKQAAALFPPEVAPKPKPKKDTTPPPDDAKADKARLALLEARLQNELALFKARNAEEESANQVAYDQGLESLQQFYAKKKTLAANETEEQIAILTKERNALKADPTLDPAAGSAALAQKRAKFDNEIAIAKIQGATKQGQLDESLAKAQESHQKTLLGYQAQILSLQGNTYEAAITKIQAEGAAIRRELVQSGLSPEAADAELAKVTQLKTATAQFNEQKQNGEEALNDLAMQREAINIKVTSGELSQYGAQQQIANLELSRIPTLEKTAAAMHAAAISPDQIRAADQFSLKIKQMGASAQAVLPTIQNMARQAGSAIQGNLNTFLTQTVFQARNIGQAFQELAGSVVGAIQKMIVQELIHIATLKLQAAAAKAASAAGGGGGGGGILGLIGAFAGGMAEGGLVSGPGTATSDSIPARLSDGEFVVRASAVRAVGVDALAAINRGMRIPAINGLSTPRFAEGGLVQTGTGSNGVDLNIGLDLAEGLVLKHLSSKHAGKIVLSHIGANPKAVSKAVSRGQ